MTDELEQFAPTEDEILRGAKVPERLTDLTGDAPDCPDECAERDVDHDWVNRIDALSDAIRAIFKDAEWLRRFGPCSEMLHEDIAGVESIQDLVLIHAYTQCKDMRETTCSAVYGRDPKYQRDLGWIMRKIEDRIAVLRAKEQRRIDEYNLGVYSRYPNGQVQVARITTLRTELNQIDARRRAIHDQIDALEEELHDPRIRMVNGVPFSSIRASIAPRFAEYRRRRLTGPPGCEPLGRPEDA